MPKTWTYEKFQKNIWEIGGEINKVVLSFIRQLLGVHKKTTNLAILGETGVYPIAVKMFIHIIKYWFRMKNSDNQLLKACKEANLMHDHSGLQNWHKIVRFLLKITDINPLLDQTDKEDEKTIDTFKQKIKAIYQNWWHEKLTSDENKKLVFF